MLGFKPTHDQRRYRRARVMRKPTVFLTEGTWCVLEWSEGAWWQDSLDTHDWD